MRKELNNVNRRKILSSLLLGGLTLPLSAKAEGDIEKKEETQKNLNQNPLLWAVAWSTTAAEYAALCYQAFNLAQLRVEQFLKKDKKITKPLGVITDVDNTVVHAASYWGYLVNNGIDFFDDEIWDQWIPKNLITPVPGAREFLQFCQKHQVEVFYVTNRDQGERTYEYALRQLRYLEFPYADKQHLTVYRDTSNKMPTKQRISQSHHLILMLGDNLNDYKRDYYIDDIEERYSIMERDRYEFGEKFILLPNATDGHWVRAIFGESEPSANERNREILRKAAAKQAWDGT